VGATVVVGWTFLTLQPGPHPQRLRASGVAVALRHRPRRTRTRPVSHRRGQIPGQPASPLFKLYIINGREAFHGFYPVGEQAARGDEDSHSVYLTGKDTPLFHQEATDDPEAVGSQYVNQANNWFDSIWTNNSTDDTL
jgi:hypothetical protein